MNDKPSETQNLLVAFIKLLKKESRADILVMLNSAVRAIEVLPAYEHDKIALAILRLPVDTEDEDDAE